MSFPMADFLSEGQQEEEYWHADVVREITPADTLVVPDDDSRKGASSPITAIMNVGLEDDAIDSEVKNNAVASSSPFREVDHAVAFSPFLADDHTDFETDTDTDSESENSAALLDPAMRLSRLAHSARTLPLITTMATEKADALAGRDLGQELRDVAQAVSAELLEPLNGVDYYHHHRPLTTQPIESITSDLFALHTRPDANEVITTIILTNIQTLHHMSSTLENFYKALRKRACEIVGLSTLPDADKSWLRAEVEKLTPRFEGCEMWEEVLKLECELSHLALERMNLASEVITITDMGVRGQFPAEWVEEATQMRFSLYQNKRVEMWELVSELYEKTGNADFLMRHRNELWDVVDHLQLEGVDGPVI